MSLTAILGAASLLSSLFNGKSSSGSTAVTDPAASMDSSELDPVLQKLFNAVDRSSTVAWDNTYSDINDSLQARGVSGGGIQIKALSEAARQAALDAQAQKQSYALQLYQLWLQRRQQERDWALSQQQRADAQSARNQQNRSNLWNTAGTLIGMGIGSGKVGGYGSGSGSTGSASSYYSGGDYGYSSNYG